MVIGAFPVAKLGALLMKQVSKPIANILIRRAKNYPFFRTYICMPPAQFYNWCEVKAKMWIMNLGKPVNIPPLNEQMAIELGANLIGETLIFVMAASILYSEYLRQSRKETQKEESRKEEIQRLNMILEDLYFQSEKQDAQIRELMRTINELQGKVIHKPWIGRRDPDKASPPPPTPPTAPHYHELLPVPGVDDIKKPSPNNPESSPYSSIDSYKIGGNSGIILKALDYFECEVKRKPYHISDS